MPEVKRNRPLWIVQCPVESCIKEFPRTCTVLHTATTKSYLNTNIRSIQPIHTNMVGVRTRQRLCTLANKRPQESEPKFADFKIVVFKDQNKPGQSGRFLVSGSKKINGKWQYLLTLEGSRGWTEQRGINEDELDFADRE
jgi:hypothetical protein